MSELAKRLREMSAEEDVWAKFCEKNGGTDAAERAELHSADLLAAAEIIERAPKDSDRLRRLLLGILQDMPEKLDPRLKYREMQFSDGEIAEIRAAVDDSRKDAK